MREYSDRIEVSFWFAPLVASVTAFILAHLMLWLDAILPNLPPGTFGLYYTGTAVMARAALLGIAGTILATTGVVFSLLTVPLSVAAGQYGSRLLRVYLKDPITHRVLGIFVGAFIYCLTLGLSLPDHELGIEPPQIAMTVAILLVLAIFASMIVLIHNISVLLQAPNMIAAASQELRDVIRSYTPLEKYRPPEGPDQADRQRAEAALYQKLEQEGKPIIAERVGYIQDINPKMADLLERYPDLVVHFVRKPGDFIHPGDVIARVWPPQISNPRMLRQIRYAYRLGNSRSPAQDIEYGVNQLTEVALRAMSPAINDPFTTMTCLDHISAGIALFAELVPREAFFYDSEDKLRIIIDPLSYSELLDAAFNMLRAACRDNAEVLLCMLNNIDVLAQKDRLPEHRLELARQVRLIEMESQASSSVDWDKERVSGRCAGLLSKLEGNGETHARAV